MKTYKNEKKGYYAIATETTAYIANAETGDIYKHYPVQHLPIGLTETYFPFDFESKKQDFIKRQEAKRLEYLESQKKKREAEEAKELEFQKKLAAWQNNETEVFIVSAYQRDTDEGSGRNYYPDYKVVFGREEADKLFDEIKESEDCPEGTYWFTEVIGIHKELEYDIEDRKECETEDCVRDYVLKFIETVYSHDYSPALPNECYILTFYKKHTHNVGCITNMTERRTWSGWVGNSYFSPQDNLSDLAKNEDRSFSSYQVCMTLEQIAADEQALRYAASYGIISKEDALSFFDENDLYRETIEAIFEEETDEESDY